MKAHDREDFIRALEKEIYTHTRGKHWEVIPKEAVPKGKRVLDSIWEMRCKRYPKTGKVIKWNARLNIHGGQQVKGVDCQETFSPVVTWIAIHLFLML